MLFGETALEHEYEDEKGSGELGILTSEFFAFIAFFFFTEKKKGYKINTLKKDTLFSRRKKLATNVSLSLVWLANIITMLNTVWFRRG